MKPLNHVVAGKFSAVKPKRTTCPSTASRGASLVRASSAPSTQSATSPESAFQVIATCARWGVDATAIGEVTGEDYERRDAHPRREIKRDVLDELLFGWSAVSGQNLYRRTVVRSFGGFEDETVIPCEDRLLWMRAACRGPVVLVPETVMSYRYHAGQKRPDDIIALRDEVAERIIRDRSAADAKRLRKLRQAGRMIEQAEATMSTGNPFSAAWTALRAFVISPRVFFSPLVGEWVIRRLGGRLYRRFFPAKSR